MTGPIRLYTSMSLDGFITGPNDREGHGLGDNGRRVPTPPGLDLDDTTVGAPQRFAAVQGRQQRDTQPEGLEDAVPPGPCGR